MPSTLLASDTRAQGNLPSGCAPALLAFTNRFLAGDLPSEMSHVLAAATLIVLRKKDSGSVRPIAIGEVLRRLAAKCAFNSVKEDAKKIFSTLQLGVSTPFGCEAIARA